MQTGPTSTAAEIPPAIRRVRRADGSEIAMHSSHDMGIRNTIGTYGTSTFRLELL